MSEEIAIRPCPFCGSSPLGKSTGVISCSCVGFKQYLLKEWNSAYCWRLLSEKDKEIERLKGLLAGALASLLRERWQPGPTESEIQDDLWTYLDNADDDFPLSKDGVTSDSRINYLVKIYERKEK